MWARSVGSCQKHKPQHPHHMKVSPRGLMSEEDRRKVKLNDEVDGDKSGQTNSWRQ